MSGKKELSEQDIITQIIYRLWKSETKKRILFLSDRNALIDQTRRGDFKHFKDKMTVISKKKIDKAFEIYKAAA
ncbi:MAG: hypothetical protein Ta2F_18290 [Termitinemataceae bacterium]|nr:MAG: hypothetical protein Ta2F_18290 [Termitinemataceae bacterium]